MNAQKRHKIERLIERLRELERDASQHNKLTFDLEEISCRRIKLEKKLIDEDIDEFYEEET